MTHAAIYTRLSEDRTGEKGGTERQMADCEALAERLGLTVVERFTDLESAYRKGATRPGFDSALQAFRDGRYGALIVWRADRLARASREWAKVIPMADDDGLRIIGANDGVDSATTGGRLTLGILSEAARNEAATMASRIKSASRGRAAAGRPHGGRHRPFGHRRDGSLEPEEAAAIQNAAERLLAGESHFLIVKDWDARGVTTAEGRAWTLRSFKALMVQSRLAGARELDGQLISTGAIEPILELETLQRLRLHFDSTRSSARRASRLLSGLVVCGRCGERMTVHSNQNGPTYYCTKRSTGNHHRGCGKVGISAERLEAHVEPLILAAFATLELEAVDDTLPGLEAELLELAARSAHLARMWALGQLPEADWRTAGEAIHERSEHLRAILARKRATATTATFAGEWSELTLAQRRAVARGAGLRVTIGPAIHRGPRWQPERIELTFTPEGS